MSKSNEMLEQAKRIWGNLGLGQKTAVLGITMAVFVGIFLTAILASKAEYKPLKSNVSSKDLGAITAQLEATGITDYKITADGTTILVNTEFLEKARNGLYQSGLISSEEVEDSDLGFLGVGGLTGNAEKYHHARKDERRLSLMIKSLDVVDFAKVSITNEKTRYYKNGSSEAKAAVVVKTRGGVWNRDLSESIALMVSGGVEGLSPDNVSITANGHLARRPGRAAELGLGDDDQIAAQMKMEQEKEVKAQEALNLVAGPGKIIVRVSMDMDWTRQQVSETKYDPDGVRTERMTQESTKDTPLAPAGGAAGGQAAQNGAATAGQSNGFTNKTTTESTKFGVTESSRVKVGPELKRMTAAVVIDEDLADKQQEIVGLISAAIGFDQARGDVVSVAIMDIPEIVPEVYSDETEGTETSTEILAWIERSIYILLGVAFLFFALRTVKKAQAGLREVLEASLTESSSTEPPKPITLEETVLETAMHDTELAGRSLRRWLYEGAAERV